MSTNRYDFEGHELVPVDRTATKILYISTAKYGGDWYSMMHSHAFAEIFYVVGGSGQFKIEDVICPVLKDDMVVVNANVEHTEISLNAAPLEYIVLGIEGLEFSAGLEGDDRFCILNFQRGREDILHHLRSMLWEIENKAANYATVCQDLLEILLIILLRRKDFLLMPTQTGAKTLKSCAAVRRYIDGHFKENITLDQLAELAHFNKYYMVHSFSRQYGISPINYMIGRRIEESKHLLAETDYSVSQISNMIGFSSPSYFSQSFHKLEGMSPIEYKKKKRPK